VINEIRLGDIVNLVGFIMAGVGFVYTMYYRTKSVEGGIDRVYKRLDSVDHELKRQTDILVQLAEQRQRLSALEQMMRDLRSETRGGC
jgi:hypothetical protein